MARGLVIVAAAIGCGRFGFEARRSGDAAPRDSAPDAAPNIQRVQVLAPGYGSAAQVSVTIQQTAGNLEIAAVYWDEVPDAVTLSDTVGNAWTSLPQLTLAGCGGPTGNGTGAQLYYATTATTGANTVSVAQTSGTQPLGLMLLEYSGVGALELHTEQMPPSASNNLFVPPLATTGTDLIIAFFNETIGQGTISEGTGFTVQARDTGFPNLFEDAIGPSGSYTPTAALPNAQIDACWVGTAAAFHAR